MYQNCCDPWEQTTREKWASEKAVALNLMKKLRVRKVMELGSGLGMFSNMISKIRIDVLEIDISVTAVKKSVANYPNCRFLQADVLNFDIYYKYKPELIVMAEITWYILDKLDKLLDFIRSELSQVYLIHLLTTYGEGTQGLGKDKFTNLEEIMNYRTYFLGSYRS